MQASELRIGNYVIDDENSLVQVYSISKSDTQVSFKTKNNHTIYYSSDIAPIPITKEWIKKTKLNEGNGIHNSRFSGLLSTKYHELISSWYLYIGTIEVSCIEYVHQLQNLYFALTGEELEVKE